MDEREILAYGLSDSGLYWMGVNIVSEENGKTEQERWLYAARKFKEEAEQIELTWAKADD